MSKLKYNLSGKSFGRLRVLRYTHSMPFKGSFWHVVCECGHQKIVSGYLLRDGHTKSCGCIQREFAKTGKSGLKHGYRNTPEYKAWQSMKQRCLNENNASFPRYGGRGIAVYERWLESFQVFLSDMGPRPSAKHSLGRINNDGNYEPTNCAWQTSVEQYIDRTYAKAGPTHHNSGRKMHKNTRAALEKKWHH
jgi:hypothetical protein